MSTPSASADNRKRQRRGHGRATLHDIATAAGVTRITVSRYLREPHLVALETGARIREAIVQTGYVPNLQAGQLASGQSRMVAALIPNMGHSIFGETIQGLTEGLRTSGYELLLTSTDYSMEHEEEQLCALMGWGPAAVIVTGRQHSAHTLGLLQRAQLGGTPVLEIWDHREDDPDTLGFGQIGFDHQQIGRAMARHLLDLGHRAIAYVDSGVAQDFRAHERGQGVADEARAQGAEFVLLRAGLGDAFDAGRQMWRALRSRRTDAGQPFTAAAFANDHLACGALMEAQQDGGRIPADLAVLGFGDFPIGRQLRPALSTVRPPCHAIGRAAAETVIEALRQRQAPRSRLLPCELVVRQSTRG
jgi:LacI family gluconate utilization system Gnt-I transcriptional repressor